jgi:enoyl-CoA hydratase/carnithine racemase
MTKPPPASEPMLVVERDAALAVVTLNRPRKLNAMGHGFWPELRQVLAELEADAALRCVIITGAGDKAFSAGGDIASLAELGDVVDRRAYQQDAMRTFMAVEQSPLPIIAAVNGYAFGGGCELAMHCDLIVAGEGATFAQPEVRVGIMPGAGGTQRLVRAVGKFRAMKMLLTGEPVSARDALAMGLASEVVADEQVFDRALAIAKTIAGMPPLAILQIKEAVLAGEDSSLEAGLLLERKAFQLLFATADQKEGMRAFLEKRKPEFEGR